MLFTLYFVAVFIYVRYHTPIEWQAEYHCKL